MADKLTEHNAKLEENLQQYTDQFAHSLDLRMKELEIKMETKLKDLYTNITEEVPNKVNQNWNDVVEPKQEHIRNIIQQEREKQKIEDEDRDFREQNIIIYQVAESKEQEAEQRRNHDIYFSKERCEDALKAGPIGTKQMIRKIANRTTTSTGNPYKQGWPGKNNEKCQASKGCGRPLKNISISYDYNKDEREKIKKSVTAAKEL